VRLTMKERKPLYRVMAERYQKASKKERSKLLDEFVDITAMNKSYAATLLRKHGIKLRIGRVVLEGDIAKQVKRGGRKRYYDEKVVEKLNKLFSRPGCGSALWSFWSYAKERLIKFYGVSKENFVYYLKELDFRYNYRPNIEDNLYVCLGGIK